MLILASASPRRQEILQQMGYTFSVQPAHIEELIEPHWNPGEAVANLSEQKALAVSRKNPEDFVLGSDTVVVFKGEILGKPNSYQQAKDWLVQMQGNSHTVYTGVSICKNGRAFHSDFQETKVYFNPQPPEAIEAYLKTNEYQDKAGAYGIQGYGCRLVQRIEGCYYNVMGLPIELTLNLLNEWNIHE